MNKYWYFSQFFSLSFRENQVVQQQNLLMNRRADLFCCSLLSGRSCFRGDPVVSVMLLSGWYCVVRVILLSGGILCCQLTKCCVRVCTCGESMEMNQASMDERLFKCHVSLIRSVTADLVLRSLSLISLFAVLQSVYSERLRTRKRNFSLMFHVSQCKLVLCRNS